jgi:hypothetical protein
MCIIPEEIAYRKCPFFTVSAIGYYFDLQRTGFFFNRYTTLDKWKKIIACE